MLKEQDYKTIKFKRRDSCVICGSRISSAAIDLPKFPLTEIFRHKKPPSGLGYVDQQFQFCPCCGHGQLANLIDQRLLYGSDYFTRTSASLAAQSALDVFLSLVEKWLGKKKAVNIFEIGANDLYCLKRLSNKADLLYGIDPAFKDKEISFRHKKISLISGFAEDFDWENLSVPPEIIISSHTLEHIADPRGLLQRLLACGSADTLYFFQFPCLDVLVREARFDQVFHQHLNYFSLASFCYLLDSQGAELLELKINPYHWGSLMAVFKKGKKAKCRRKARPNSKIIKESFILKQFTFFKENMQAASQRIALLKGEPLFGYGAALMLPVLDYYLKNLRRLECILDDDPRKNGLYYLNFPLQIKLPSQVKRLKDSAVVVTAINSVLNYRAVVARLIALKVRQIILPLNLI